MYEVGDLLNTKDGAVVPNAIVLQDTGESEEHGDTYRVLFENGKTAIMPAVMIEQMFHEPGDSVNPSLWMAQRRHNWQNVWPI